MKEKEGSVFDQFTNQYSLSKTLRFELKPIEKTLENMREHLQYDKKLQTFFKDQNIEDAYQTMKPLFDKIHEEFITDSLTGEKARQINFSSYLNDYRSEKELKASEDGLRKEISEAFIEAGEKWKKEKYSQYEWKKGSKIANGADILSTQDMLELIKDLNPDNQQIKEIINETFKGFFTYFSGFNQNRENYYETKKEATTAVATRIVHENLPKFCDNLIQFEGFTKKKKDGSEQKIERMSEYLNAYKFLKDHNKTTQINDAQSGEMIETSPIKEYNFKISYFLKCLSQSGIEEYNQIIGHYNLLINLYNQEKRREEKHLTKKEKTFRDLPKFKTLYKQIGCGKKDPLFFSLTHDTKKQTEENKENYRKPYSVEQILEQAKAAGEKYFQGKSDDGIINTTTEFKEYILGKESYEGVYWSRAAMNTISDKYFANYHDLKDRLQEAKVFQKAKKEIGEDIKIPEAIELTGLFAVLDTVTENWQQEGVIFRNSLTEKPKEEKTESKDNQKRAKRKSIIAEAKKPSEALLKMIFDDLEDEAKQFIDSAEDVLTLNEYKSKESKEPIKKWMDHALAINRMLKYFLVKESKIKGVPLDPVISEALTILLRAEDAEWFWWYDALRNYLTKKPQDDAKENKLKLNFENNGSFLNGFVDSHTNNSDAGTQYGGYLFRKRNSTKETYDYLLGICQDKKLFRCHLKDEVKKEDQSNFERLEYYQVKSTTFFNEQYSINKKNIVDYLSQKIKEKINQKKTLMSKEKEIKQIDDLGKKLLKSNTPTGLIESISKQKDFLDILNHSDFQKLISKTIDEIKKFVENYQKRTTKLKEIQRKSYKGHFGLKNLIDDLQTIAKEHKEYNYFPIGQKEFQEVCERKEKTLYVFQITNKDINKKKETGDQEEQKTGKKSVKNIHTLYFETMLAGDQSTFDIGSGEIFYRKQALKERKAKEGYEKKPWVIESKRFTENEELGRDNLQESEKCLQGKTFFLHLSLKLNYTKSDKYKSLNFSNFEDFTNVQLSSSPNLHFLGIDRGEKHLAYYSLIDQDGKIINQGTLNLPFVDKNGNPRSIKKDRYFYDKKEDKWKAKEVDCWDYNDLLDATASNRDMARKNWQTISTIKELKNGYVSQVVRKIADLATVEDHPAFIVLEDLNTGFKRGRQKIEKQVYQKLELALAKKLNFLVDKTKQNGELGSVTKALQLTPPVNNYQDIENKKQLGIMFYTRANYTSQTDPATGWRKSIYLKVGSKENIKRQIIDNFSDILLDGKDYVFIYTDKNTGTKWKLYSGKDGKSLDRFHGERDDHGQWVPEKQDITSMLKKLFASFDENRSLLMQMIYEEKELAEINERTAWESLRFVIHLIQQIRNTGKQSNERDSDFIQSPVRDEKTGKHFDSREYWDKEQEEQKKPLQERIVQSLPTSGDANGAYNIAVKGLIMDHHIKTWKTAGEKKGDLNLFIQDEEWSLYLSNRSEWERKLPEFSSWELIKKKKVVEQ